MTPEQLVARVFGQSPFSISDFTERAEVEGWDSLGHVNLILEVEKAYSISITTDEALEITGISSLKRVLRSHGMQV
jgi:acyl carrier protein